MPPNERPIDELVAAILDGTPVDWDSVNASKPLIAQLKVLAALADLPRDSRGDMLWGHLRVLDRLGSGSFGEVYRAWDTRLDREVALKLLPAVGPSGERKASAIIEEGRLLARVRHPNVVTIYGAEQIADRIGLWMEFVRGQTLEQILDARGVVSVAEAISIGVELCRAVSAVHGAGVIHRDIKTHNVMRADDGRIVLMDFGTGRDRDDDRVSDLTGTPLYLSPEVLQGGQASVQSDVYSLAVLLYRLLTGSYPVHATSVDEVRHLHARGVPISLQAARSDVPGRLARVIERALEAQPDRRYRSVEALGADLQSLARRSRVGLAHAAGWAVAFLLLTLAWEGVGRRIGSAQAPSALLTHLIASLNPGASGITGIDRPVLAVLPFTSASAYRGTDYIIDGLTERIIRNLAVVQGLEVRARTSSFAFKGKPRNLRQVADTLGANLVVEGSAERDGNRLRVSVQLVDVDSDRPLWAEHFDEELKDVFLVQDDISRAIVSRLGLTYASRQGQSTSLDAYEIYLQAHALVDRRGVPNALRAAELFEQVIVGDPGFAPAHAGLATAQAFMSFPYRGVAFETAYPTMRRAALRAIELDPGLAEAHAAMGWVHAYEHDWQNAEKAFQQAIRLDPGLTQASTSYSVSTLQPLEKWDEAMRLLEVALVNDPLSLDVQREIGEVQLFSGRYTDAVDTFQRVSELEPDFPFVHTFLARALMLSGRVDEAFPLLEPAVPYLAYGLVMTGRRAEAERLADEWERYPYRSAIICAALGDTGRAIAALERAAIVEPHRMGRLFVEPEISALRANPRVAALRRKFGLR